MAIRKGDTFTIRLTEDALRTLHEVEGIEFVPEVTPPGGLDALGPGQTLIEIVVTAGSDLVGETVESSRFQDQYRTAVLAIRRGGETAYERLTEYRIRPGDLLLIESEPDTVDRLADDPNVIVAGELALQSSGRRNARSQSASYSRSSEWQHSASCRSWSQHLAASW